jgi:hypothetical protein
MLGRRGKGYEVLGVRELSADEVKHLRRAKLPAVKRLRHAHHRLALLIATGLQDSEVAVISGYSLTRIGSLKADPAFRDLIAVKAGMIEAHTTDQIAEYNSLILTNGIKAEQLIADKLDAAIDDEAEDIPWAVLLKTSRDAADRVGLAKRSVALNMNVDFASQLQKAVQRSRMKVIEGSANPIESSPTSLPTPPVNAPVEGSALSGKESFAPSPRPVLIHESPPLVIPALAHKPDSRRPGLVTRRTA